ncbi:MAG: hypothetical protein HQL97_01215 [Magnetococcales bacterium]|nr:hypothetical protein [Magnetococcales bacterium]
MANFASAFAETSIKEGGYSNHPNDRGGETYRGIARRVWPAWPGWSIIDFLKGQGIDPRKWTDNAELNHAVEGFFKVNFWDPFRGDEIQSQLVAEELYDTSVNMGMAVEVKFLQRAVNLLSSGSPLTVDGKCGPATIAALNALSLDRRRLAFNILNVLQGNRYIEIMEADPSQEVFIVGWLSRVRTA